jgi:DNA repair protein RadC
MNPDPDSQVPEGSGPPAGYPIQPARPPRVYELPRMQQPRELFDQRGPRNVSDSVLLALLLRTGVPGSHALALSEQLLKEFGSLAELAAAPVQILRLRRGIGPVKAQILKAAFELARRLSEEQAPERMRIACPADVELALRQEARTETREVFWVLVLNAKNRMVCPPRAITHGLRNASLVHPREVFREAVPWNGISIILAHNHPSGDPEPSAEDLRVTGQLVEAGRTLDIPVLDHVILGGGTESGALKTFSLRESGLVSF